MNTTELFERLGEPARLQRLAAYNLFHPDLAPRLDEITRRSATLLTAPVCLVSVVLDSSQVVLSGHGVTGWIDQAGGIPAEWALCTRTVLGRRPYLVTDGTTDARHSGNPLLAMTGLRSYAGVPLIDGSGFTLGAHCIIDTAARTFTDSDIDILTEGAQATMRVFDEHRRG